MATISVSLPSDGQTIDASDYNTPITTIVNEFNGNIDNDNVKTGAAISGAKLADATVSGAKLGSPYAPQGYMQNGVISRTVANSDITVAIKTLAGTDPSATDPVYVRIGDTVRSITSALSVTKADGTNWFAAGSGNFGAFEIDYFVYLGYNATDGVVIGFARISHGRIYSDFSATSTNEKYCAISTITNAVASDQYELVGRFNATLGVSATFLWTVPATSVVISRPIYEGRWLSYSTTIVGFSGTPTQFMRYRVVRFGFELVANITGTSNATNFTWTLPFTPANGTTVPIIMRPTDNSANPTTPAMAYISDSNATVTNFLTTFGTAWTNSGTKAMEVAPFFTRI